MNFYCCVSFCSCVIGTVRRLKNYSYYIISRGENFANNIRDAITKVLKASLNIAIQTLRLKQTLIYRRTIHEFNVVNARYLIRIFMNYDTYIFLYTDKVQSIDRLISYSE